LVRDDTIPARRPQLLFGQTVVADAAPRSRWWMLPDQRAAAGSRGRTGFRFPESTPGLTRRPNPWEKGNNRSVWNQRLEQAGSDVRHSNIRTPMPILADAGATEVRLK